MINREEKIKDFIENLELLKRTMVFHACENKNMPKITPAQWGVLMFVEQNENSTIKEVAGALHVTSSAITQFIDDLVASGYIIKKLSKEDKRIVFLNLSQKIKMHVNRMKKKSFDKFLKIFEALDDNEFDKYILLNKKIIEKLLVK